MLARKSENVRAARRLEGLGLLGRQAVAHPEYEGLQEACRFPAYAGQGRPAGGAGEAPRARERPAPVQDHDLSRLGEQGGAGAIAGDRAREGAAAPHERS